MRTSPYRKEYKLDVLDETSTRPDPFEQFSTWYDWALKSGLDEPDAMTLATCSVDGKPSARSVLLKGFGPEGFVFFTNYHSRKAAELEANPHAALLFLWSELERQVRIEGRAKKLSAQRSDSYFATRPRGAQIGAHISPQSKAIQNRAELERWYKEAEHRFEGKEIPRPVNWGGYLVVPHSFEFWQGRESRLSDRILFTKKEQGRWEVQRLAP